MKGENRKFMMVVLVSFFILVAVIVGTTLYFSISAISNNADTSRELLVDLMRKGLENKLADFSRMLRDPIIIDFFERGSGGDAQRSVINLFTMMEINLEDPYYLALVREGKVIDSKLPEEIGKPLPPEAQVEGSTMVDTFRRKTGDLIIMSAPLTPEIRAVVVKDISQEVSDVEKTFTDQKNHIKWVSFYLLLGFLALALVLVFLVIGPANTRYISGPIKDLEIKAVKIMEGDTSVEVEVEEHSDYYALESLLDSMRKLLNSD